MSKKKYRVQQIRDCFGCKVGKIDIKNGFGRILSTNDLNQAYQKVAQIENRIKEKGKHSTTCWRFSNEKCRVKLEVQEVE